MSSIPRWGRVVARPHEALIHIRDGRVVESGQGASCFKWPGDSVALIPTSIEKLSFSADQVTREKVGVEVTGLAVYRIVEPLLAYRMLDLGTNRLGEVLRDMFVGATRRIVATLSLEDCLSHRKERVARALLEEIAPVLAGEGAAEDTTRTGWGVVLDTIEIQDVRVLSEAGFGQLQAPFRERLAREAIEARAAVQRTEDTLAAERAHEAERRRRELAEEEQARVRAEHEREVALQRHAEALRAAALEAEIERAERQQQAELALRVRREQVELAEQERAAAAKEARKRAALARRREASELEIALARARREARGDPSEAELREIMLTSTMPRVAEAFRGSFDRIQLHGTQGAGGELFAFLSAGLETVGRAAEAARDPRSHRGRGPPGGGDLPRARGRSGPSGQARTARAATQGRRSPEAQGRARGPGGGRARRRGGGAPGRGRSARSG